MKIIKNYLYNVFYQVFVLLVPLVTMPYIARVLGPTGVGINSFTNSNTQYFILLGSIGVSLYGNRQIAYYRDNRAKASQIFWEVFLMRMITIVIALGAFFVFLGFVQDYHQAYVMQAILIVAAAFDISWFFMGFENFKVTVLRNIIIKLISLACIFIFVKGKGDLTLYIAILSISQLIGNLTLFPYLKHYINLPNWRELKIWQHFKPSMVLFVPQIATQVYLILNKTMVGKMVSVEAAGFYDNSDKIVKMVLAIVTATGTVMLPRVANTFAKGDHEQVKKYLYQSFDFVSVISVPLMFGIAAIAPKFATMFFGKAFAPVGPLMMLESVVILLIAWSNVLGVQYLLPTGHNREFTISVTIGAIVNIILNIPLILWIGTQGAMIATVLSEVSVTAYQFYVVRHDLDLGQMAQELWKYLLAGFMMFAVVLYMNLTMPFSMVKLVIQVLIGIVIYGGVLLLTRPKILNYIKRGK
ncbi:flippase [Latilactobacillus fuchuensis]|uniref:PST family polysaccharide transporter n=1 Tax=Latilactobacillus fuchuensis DSM 14340 = JCM 11249 TaxID=1423747 RepID=A0A0R1RR91_9LACO|nr:flippase [Latilactobacillus fuchuensis]KRL59281.1 PST family polysaccharide transporter [Latilactobacillus fuchuensis DSM 14340 = JCM 11249]